ncbi:predicted protein [Thalassiosira pseudonana CCMP1335]|uniref:Phosphoglycerate mutase-like protein n=1 Tax=Thalassiosira pseudonana TaxID=35128 RepID=B8BXT3_THAPS|nr:predicted protein [Thalassiosira pseudonana CCMP1335]EED94262.1 predicted protein [Thalassiosira pseudonana CCMP1335]
MIISRLVASRLPSASAVVGTQVRRQGSAAISRVADQTASTTRPPRQHSTIFHRESQDFSSVALKRDDADYYFEEHSEALLSSINSYTSAVEEQQHEILIETPSRVTAVAHDMDLVQAAYAAHDYESYDKVMILMRHGEARHHAFHREQLMIGKTIEESNLDEEYPVDPMLTGKGCGQMMALSRRTANFFNKETGLKPDLFVVSPLRRAIQSAMIAFPTQTALVSLDNTPWVCNPLLMEQANGHKSEYVSSPQQLEETFPGVNFELLEQMLGGEDVNTLNMKEKVPLFESKIDLMRRSDQFLQWIKERPERVIVVSSQATWLHSFCEFSLQYEPENKGREMFKKGEMRSVGIKFD